MIKKVLIAGASGRFGAQAAQAFAQAGWDVSTFNRKSETLLNAAKGVDVIVNAMNPPDYLNWDTEIPRITGEVIDAAKANGATVLIPGNVYNFGTQRGPWSDKTPQIAQSRKGQIRIEMEDAYRASGVKTIILRGGDFMGGDVSGTWLDLVILKSITRGKFVYPGDPDVPHAWAYLPDMARAAVGLAEKRDSLEDFVDVAFPGYAVSGREMMRAISEITGRNLELGKMPWWGIRLASPFWRLGRELLEMRYLWDHPHSLEAARFSELLPEFVATDFDEAIAEVLPVDVNPDKTMVRGHSFA